eukprot:TRINITY_DN554_c1_g3_i1.p1 TRINITY_DN554_c1_g3~~TRINITY_DN554_c1_g3_i1.p1  ORF type:complete len:235 (+),score=51.93 TRINITY_DN554_c1_g3_i1:108-812(+)
MDSVNAGLSLVWCSERCFKKDQADTLEKAEAATTKIGASLVRMRKTARFSQWFLNRKSQAAPYILVTDWREAKPSFSHLLESAHYGTAPELFIVVCDKPATRSRAASWALEQQGCVPFPIYTCSENDIDSVVISTWASLNRAVSVTYSAPEPMIPWPKFLAPQPMMESISIPDPVKVVRRDGALVLQPFQRDTSPSSSSRAPSSAPYLISPRSSCSSGFSSFHDDVYLGLGCEA